MEFVVNTMILVWFIVLAVTIFEGGWRGTVVFLIISATYLFIGSGLISLLPPLAMSAVCILADVGPKFKAGAIAFLVWLAFTFLFAWATVGVVFIF